MESHTQMTQRCRIVTYNVNSLRARMNFLLLFLDAHQPDVICLQELKGTKEQLEDYFNVLRKKGYYLSTHTQPKWNGVLIGSKKPITYEEFDFEGELFESERQSRFQYVQTFGIHLVNIYCPQGESTTSSKFQYKKRFYKYLIDWMERHITNSHSWIITGDFNIAPLSTDVWDSEYWKNKPTYHPEEHALWTELLECGLSDIGKNFLPDRSYTFFDNRTYKWSPQKGLRIDHFLGNRNVQHKVTGCKVYRDWRDERTDTDLGVCKPSDHVPLELTLQLLVETAQSQVKISSSPFSTKMVPSKNIGSFSESDSESSGIRVHSMSHLIQTTIPFLDNTHKANKNLTPIPQNILDPNISMLKEEEHRSTSSSEEI